MVLVWLVFLLAVLSLVQLSRPVTFYDLPLGAVNGEWSAVAVANGDGLNESIEQLAYRVNYIVRAEIIDKREEIVGIGLRGERIYYLYSFYNLSVLDVYKGDVRPAKKSQALK